MRLVRFPAVRRAISGGLERAMPEKVHIPAAGAFIRFRLEDPSRHHPALFSTLRRGQRGTLIVIGTPRAHIKKKAALEAFLRRMGWDARGRRWTRRLSAEERRSMIYQLRAAGITGGSRAQAVLIPRARVAAVAARFLSKTVLRRVGSNPVIYHRGVREDRLGGLALQPHPGTVGGMSLHYTKASGRKLRTIRGVEYAEVYDSRVATHAPNPAIRVGDKVKYKRAWLRSVGAFTGPHGPARGVVTALERLGDSFLAVIKWDRPGPAERVLVDNLAPAAKLEAENRPRRNPILATLGIGNPGHRRNAYACYKCGKRIKGEVTHHVPPVLHERLGVDFKKAFHPECYKEWQAEAGRELGLKNPLTRREAARELRRARYHTTLAKRYRAKGSQRHASWLAGMAQGTAATVAATSKAGYAAAVRVSGRAEALRNPRLSFEDWMREVERAVQQRVGLSVHDLADVPFMDWYEDGVSPRSAAARAIRSAGENPRGKCPPGMVLSRRGKCVRPIGHWAKRVAGNPGVQTINVPFRNGQKVSPGQMRRWLGSLGNGSLARALRARFEQNMAQYRRFHLDKKGKPVDPKFFTYRAIPMGLNRNVTDVDFVTSEGKEWAATYQVPRHSGKYAGDGSDGRYVHAHGESKLDIDIKRAVRRGKLPERFHTADGKFVGVIPSKNVKIGAWYTG